MRDEAKVVRAFFDGRVDISDARGQTDLLLLQTHLRSAQSGLCAFDLRLQIIVFERDQQLPALHLLAFLHGDIRHATGGFGAEVDVLQSAQRAGDGDSFQDIARRDRHGGNDLDIGSGGFGRIGLLRFFGRLTAPILSEQTADKQQSDGADGEGFNRKAAFLFATTGRDIAAAHVFWLVGGFTGIRHGHG